MKIEQTADGVVIALSMGSLTLNFEEAWELLEGLYQIRDSLYQGSQVRYLPGEVRSLRKQSPWERIASHIGGQALRNEYERSSDE